MAVLFMYLPTFGAKIRTYFEGPPPFGPLKKLKGGSRIWSEFREWIEWSSVEGSPIFDPFYPPVLCLRWQANYVEGESQLLVRLSLS